MRSAPPWLWPETGEPFDGPVVPDGPTYFFTEQNPEQTVLCEVCGGLPAEDRTECDRADCSSLTTGG